MAPAVITALREQRIACVKGPLDLVFPTATGNVQRLAHIQRRLGPVRSATVDARRKNLHTKTPDPETGLPRRTFGWRQCSWRSSASRVPSDGAQGWRLRSSALLTSVRRGG
jgi:hypothetical protein